MWSTEQISGAPTTFGYQALRGCVDSGEFGRHGLYMAVDGRLRLYHMVPTNLEGDHLSPLNVLKREAPHLYEAHVEKYHGREFLLEKDVPPLGVGWNDVLHLTPVHPTDIRAGLESAGAARPLSGTAWLEINPRAFQMNPSNTCLYFSLVQDRRARGEKPYFADYSEEVIAAHAALPPEVVDYYAQCVADGKRPLLFHGVLHVLFRGSIDTRQCERLVV